MGGSKIKKNYRKNYKKNYKKRNYKKRKPLTKRQTGAVKKIYKDMTDARIEDKFKLDSTWNSMLGSYNSTKKALLFEVTISNLHNGTGDGEMIGRFINMKHLRTLFRYRPSKKAQLTTVDSSAPIYTESITPRLPPLIIRLIKINNKFAGNLTNDELLDACEVKFLVPGRFAQERVNDSNMEASTAIKQIKICYLKSKYKLITAPVLPIQQNIASSGSGYVSTPVYQPQVNVLAIPQQVNKNILITKHLKGRTEINSVTSKPMKYKLYYYIQFTNAYNDNSYQQVNNDNMCLDIKNCYVYEDA